MKLLENKAENYDKGINVLTSGKYTQIKQEIVDTFLHKGEILLDIGMGTGTFAILCARKGVKVIGIDMSEKMLAVAQKNILQELQTESNRIQMIQSSVMELEHQFLEKKFDKVTAMLSFSEFYEKELQYTLKQIYRILKDDGELIIVDEVIPSRFWHKILYYLIRIPISIWTYLTSGLSTKPLKNFETRANEQNFELIERREYLHNSFTLFRFKKR
jgi:ubiquinone/menaquinone biosynthesis C-methylase UbiE